jgi:pimeloyl-ACP methyl ester carboxylesterase
MKQINSPPSASNESSNHEIIYDIPEATRHDFELTSGRNLSFYTFGVPTDADDEKNFKPVLYFHGFPGCGKEGVVCAREVADAGGKLFAIDRPGFGHSDPHDFSLANPDEFTEAFVKDLWEFVEHHNWTVFSIIAVSGGGPSSLAFLTSYLDKRAASAEHSMPRLEAVSLVATVCCGAGTKGMMKTNETLVNLASSQDKMLSRFTLNAMFAAPHYLMKVIPSSWLIKMMPMEGMPTADQEIISNPRVSECMMSILALALRQGYSASANEACILFRRKQGFEESLRRHFEKSTATTQDYPRISIYQGDLDVNVPKAHAEYLSNEVLAGSPTLEEYPTLGHLSLVFNKAETFSQFAVNNESK